MKDEREMMEKRSMKRCYEEIILEMEPSMVIL